MSENLGTYIAKRTLTLSLALLSILLWMTQSGVCQKPDSGKSSDQTSSQDTSKQARETSPSKAIEKDGVYKVGGPVLPPKLIYAPTPEYSDAARLSEVQTYCVLSFIVDIHGRPQNIEVKEKAVLGLDKNAVAAVKRYRFEPATLNGKPVPVRVQLHINFRIR